MGAAADQQPRFGIRVSQQTQLIGRDPGGINDHAGRPALLLTAWTFTNRGAEVSIGALKTNNTAIAHNLKASSRCCEQQQQVQARVIELPIAVANTAVKSAIQPRERALHPLGIEAAGGPQPSRTRHQVIKTKTQAVVAALDQPLGGQHQIEGVSQKGCLADPVPAFH